MSWSGMSCASVVLGKALDFSLLRYLLLKKKDGVLNY